MEVTAAFSSPMCAQSAWPRIKLGGGTGVEGDSGCALRFGNPPCFQIGQQALINAEAHLDCNRHVASIAYC